MKKIALLSLLSVVLFGGDIITKQSCVSVDKTIENIKYIVKKKGFGVFAVINHKGNAKAVEMKLRESKMIVFGNPKIGTKLMQEDITIGLDLPLRVLVYKDSDGKVKMAYRDGDWIAQHHIVQAPQLIKKVNMGLDNLTTKAGQCLRD